MARCRLHDSVTPRVEPYRSGVAGASSSGASPEAGAGGTSISEPIPDAGSNEGELDRDPLATSVLRILARDCGACHAGSERAGGVGDIDDIDALVSSGAVIPGAAELSPVFDSIRTGRMPPADQRSRPSAGGPRPTRCARLPVLP